MADMSGEQKIALIKENLQEVLNEHILEDVILKQKRQLVLYWGTATTGRPHCGYFVPLMKLSHFLRAGCKVKVLLADIHAGLDANKAPWEEIDNRAKHYKFVIQSVLKAIGVDISSLEFVLGSEYQLSPKYFKDLLMMSNFTSEHDSKKAGSEVVKQSENAPLSNLIYPLMQALDEEHLGVDAQFGGVDQRKIFALAQETLPKLGYRSRAHLMNSMVPGLAGGKMSASDPDSKIDFLDGPEVVKKKLKKAYAAPKETEGNGIISFIEYVLLPVSALRSDKGEGRYVIERRPEEGEALVYTSIQSLKDDYIADKVTPQLLKSSMTSALNALLAPVQAEYLASPQWKEAAKLGYPPTEPAKKPKKMPKDKGSKYPGGGATASLVDAHTNGLPQDIRAKEDGSKIPENLTKDGEGVEAAMERLEVHQKA